MSAVDLSGALSVSSVVIAAVVSILGVVGFQNRRARTAAIRSAFEDVVASLSSTEKERQLAGAVLLRRFFDESSELGMRDALGRLRAPYASEARSVLAAVLRGMPAGDLQKLLADGLAYAPTLQSADLQRTNLQHAYLAPRRSGASLAGADFYRADLSGASLKNAAAAGAVFYQARARGTIFRGADLRGANFYEADLAGARFEGALLEGATFAGAVNVPGELMAHVGSTGTYDSAEPAPAPPGTPHDATRRRVFVSLPSTRSARQESQWSRVRVLLEQQQLDVEQLPPRDYPPSGAFTEISRRMAGCAGAVIFGFRDDAASETARPTSGVTPWTHLEAGMAHGLGLPLLLVREQDVTAGAFADAVAGHHTVTITLPDSWDDAAIDMALASWARDLRE